MKAVMVSGHFDPLHDVHLDYIQYALNYGEHLICLVSTDKQILLKKGRVNVPEDGRLKILRSVLKGLEIPCHVALNVHDKDTALVAKALKYWHPDVFCRGGDKVLEDMPVEERKVCEDLNIKIVHAELKAERHGSEMQL